MAGKKKVAEPPKRIRICKNDIVKVISGSDTGKTGRVLSVDRRTGRLLVEGVMLVKRHTRPNQNQGIKGGIAERESTIHISNVMLLTGGGVPTRIGIREDVQGGKVHRTRIAVKTGEPLERK
jgi:large subunit ribosomal protein L24